MDLITFKARLWLIFGYSICDSPFSSYSESCYVIFCSYSSAFLKSEMFCLGEIIFLCDFLIEDLFEDFFEDIVLNLYRFFVGENVICPQPIIKLNFFDGYLYVLISNCSASHYSQSSFYSLFSSLIVFLISILLVMFFS